MKKSTKIISGTLIAAAAANAVHAAVYKPKKADIAPLPEEEFNVQRYRENLSKAIQFKTISNRVTEKVDWNEFERFHKFLEDAYPLIHSRLEKEVIPPANLLYRWKGTKPELKPIALLAHQDVVPVTSGTEKDWVHGAFEGVDDGEYIWGRGTIDMKNHLIAVMESVEALLADGFEPERDVYLLFGDNEEVVANDVNGAHDLMMTLKSRGIELDSVIDEGGAIIPVNVPGVLNNKYLIGIGIAEKGYSDIEIVVNGKGGHSSQPPKHNALGELARAIQALEDHQFKSSFNQLMKDLMDAIGRECTYPVRLITCNIPLLRPLILQLAKQIPFGACFVRTTTAVTMAQGSPAANVLPQRASATVNFRAMPGTTKQDLVDHIRKVCKNDNLEINVLNSKEASKFSSTDSRTFKIIGDICKNLEPNSIIAPYLVMGGTDAYNYEPICENIYRYAPFRVSIELLRGAHGTNEKIPVACLEDALKFFKNYIRRASAEE
ncbi:MAG: M20/M25/M40 family metallo-hydrolase [Clostridia bacterium]|nr:M20/M25/M40 family metallo-hydrolase [Clostridia bacterium]